MKISLICIAIGALFGFSGCATDEEVTTTTTTEETTLARPVTAASTTTETHVVRTE